MFTLNITDNAKHQLLGLARNNLREHVEQVINSCEENPFTKAVVITKPVIGSHYINAGNYYAIVLQIHEEKRVVDILQVVPQSKLYRLLK